MHLYLFNAHVKHSQTTRQTLRLLDYYGIYGKSNVLYKEWGRRGEEQGRKKIQLGISSSKITIYKKVLIY